MARPLTGRLWVVFAVAAAVLALVVIGVLGAVLGTTSQTYTAQTLLDNVPAPQVLRDHTHEFDIPEIIKVTDGIYMAIGFALANSILVEAPEGAIIIDTTESLEAGREIMAEFRKVTSSPIKAIIYTHCHHDHIQGASAFVEDKKNPPDIWAHHTLPERLEFNTYKGQTLYAGGIRQFGPMLPSNAHINSGIGPRLRLESLGYLPPNRFLEKEREDVVIAGLRLTLIHIPGETSDQMGVWYPEKKAFMCADDLYRSFPNLYAVRGTPSRNVLHWIQSIDKIRKLKPTLIVPSHTRHIEGEAFIAGLLRDYRDAIQYVHDQTVRYMNMGYFPEDTVPIVKLPEKLKTNPWLIEFYGTVEWSVFAVFAQYLGWFSTNIVDLKSMPTMERARKMVELGGGERSLCNAAKTALNNGDSQWALELATYVVNNDPDHTACREVRLGALRNLASKHTSANGRNYYLTVAMQDYKLIEMKDTRDIRVETLRTVTVKELFIIMRTRLLAEKCVHVQATAVFNFTDTGDIYTLNLRNGILEVIEESTSQYDFKVTVTLKTWKEIIGSVKTPEAAHSAGEFKIAGSLSSLVTFLDYFDKEY